MPLATEPYGTPYFPGQAFGPMGALPPSGIPQPRIDASADYWAAMNSRPPIIPPAVSEAASGVLGSVDPVTAGAAASVLAGAGKAAVEATPELMRAARALASKTGTTVAAALRTLQSAGGAIGRTVTAAGQRFPGAARFAGRAAPVVLGVAGGQAVAQGPGDIVESYGWDPSAEPGSVSHAAQYGTGVAMDTVKRMGEGLGFGGGVLPQAAAAEPPAVVRPPQQPAGPPQPVGALPDFLDTTKTPSTRETGELRQPAPAAAPAQFSRPAAAQAIVKKLDDADIDVDKIAAQTLARMGQDPRRAGALTSQQKGELLLDFGLRMMAGSQRRGSTTAGNMGEAGMGALQTARGYRQQNAAAAAAEEKRRQDAVDRAVDVEFKRRAAADRTRMLQMRAAQAGKGALPRVVGTVIGPGGIMYNRYQNGALEIAREPRTGMPFRPPSMNPAQQAKQYNDTRKMLEGDWTERAEYGGKTFKDLPPDIQERIIADRMASALPSSGVVDYGFDPNTGRPGVVYDQYTEEFFGPGEE